MAKKRINKKKDKKPTNKLAPVIKHKNVLAHSLFTEYDIYLFKDGSHQKLYQKFGAHEVKVKGDTGLYFAVFAPEASQVYVLGDFNQWSRTSHPLYKRWDESGIWEGVILGLRYGEMYKYYIESDYNQEPIEKIDPYGRYFEESPKTATIAYTDDYSWGDDKWLSKRRQNNHHQLPLSIYECHLGSWRRHEDGSTYNYRELAAELPPYLVDMGFTHVELMPIMEYPYGPSWGYQITGYYAPTSRYGRPEEFKHLVDSLHQAGIGVILDWVPSHFPADGHGLAKYDGSSVYEHPDPRRGFHPDWQSLIFNYGRPEVCAFLISNALYWIEEFHIDGLRVDAVASMLYLDYSRQDGEWEANIYGGNQNLEAISFLQQFNKSVHQADASVMTIAEESTSYEGVTRSVEHGGLGFNYKWMMGWMHDTLKYFTHDPYFRIHHHGAITFSIYYAFSEQFVLALSHDEVVHGKGSLLGRMPGDEIKRFGNIRLLYTYMYTHPGAKMIFMGAELGQYSEWAFERSLEWGLTAYPLHLGVQNLIRDLNSLYRQYTQLYELNYRHEGFEWIDYEDAQNSVLTYLRKNNETNNHLLIILNMTPVHHKSYFVGVPNKGYYEVVFNSDDELYGGTDSLELSRIKSVKQKHHGRKYSIELNLPPLGGLVFQWFPQEEDEEE